MPEWSVLQLPASKATMEPIATFGTLHTILTSEKVSKVVSADKIELSSRHLQHLAAFSHRKVSTRIGGEAGRLLAEISKMLANVIGS
jgi:hypothetical protein